MSIQPQDDPSVRCAFCLRSVPMSHAVDASWESDFQIGAAYYGEPACSACATIHLEYPDNAEPFLKTGHARFLNRGKGPMP